MFMKFLTVTIISKIPGQYFHNWLFYGLRDSSIVQSERNFLNDVQLHEGVAVCAN